MRSAEGVAPPRDDDRTTRARIRDAALAQVAAHGAAGASLRAIAERAQVSAALIVHHFGSKQKLLRACDRYVAAAIRTRKAAAMRAGTSGLDPLRALRDAAETGPLLAYLARRLVDGAPDVDALVDEMIADAEGYMRDGVESGLLTPCDDLRGRAAVLTLWSLGALVLHRHVRRSLAADLLKGDAPALEPYMRPAALIFADGVLTTEAADRLRQAFREPAPDTEEPT